MKSDQEILNTIIRDLEENPKSIKLERQQKFLLIERIVYQVHLYMCEKIREKNNNKGWICGTGLFSRIQRVVPALSIMISDEQTVILGFEMHILNDNELYSKLKQIYNLSNEEIENALRIVIEKCPRPSFHRSIELENG